MCVCERVCVCLCVCVYVCVCVGIVGVGSVRARIVGGGGSYVGMERAC